MDSAMRPVQLIGDDRSIMEGDTLRSSHVEEVGPSSHWILVRLECALMSTEAIIGHFV